MIKRNAKFIHKRIQVPVAQNDGVWEFAVCRVTKIEQGFVHFVVGDEKKAKCYFPEGDADRWVKKWL